MWGKCSENGPHRTPACLAVRKFSPLIHRTSIEPPVVLPAPFSLSSLLTASAVSPLGTIRRVIPKSSLSLLPTLERKRRLRSSSPAHMPNPTSVPRALRSTSSHRMAANSAGVMPRSDFDRAQQASTARAQTTSALGLISQVAGNRRENGKRRKQKQERESSGDRLIASALKGNQRQRKSEHTAAADQNRELVLAPGNQERESSRNRHTR